MSQLVQRVVEEVLARNPAKLPPRSVPRQSQIEMPELQRPNYQREKSRERQQQWVGEFPSSTRGSQNQSSGQMSVKSRSLTKSNEVAKAGTNDSPKPDLVSSLYRIALGNLAHNHEGFSFSSQKQAAGANGEAIGRVSHTVGMWWFPHCPKWATSVANLSLLAGIAGPFGVVSIRNAKAGHLFLIQEGLKDSPDIRVAMSSNSDDDSLWLILNGSTPSQIKSKMRQILVKFNRKEIYPIESYYLDSPSAYVLDFLKWTNVPPPALAMIDGLLDFDGVLLLDSFEKANPGLNVHLDLRRDCLLCSGEAAMVQESLKFLKQLAGKFGMPSVGQSK